jgi:hypothetical protein
MEHTYQVAGIDEHKSMLAVVISDAAREGEFQFPRRKFGATATELRAMHDRFRNKACAKRSWNRRRNTGSQCGKNWKAGANYFWRRRFPTVRRADASGISRTPNGCCDVMSPES